MERNGYWELFWQTGLPLAWLLSRRGEEETPPEAVAAFAPWRTEDEGGASQPLG